MQPLLEYGDSGGHKADKVFITLRFPDLTIMYGVQELSVISQLSGKMQRG